MKKSWLVLIVLGLAIALGVTLLSPWASTEPDGLERVAEDKDFIDEGNDPAYQVIADYVFPGVENERLATVLAGVVGVLVVSGVAFGAGFGLWALSRSRARRAEQDETASGDGGGA
jgi:hypothetical protein